MINTNSGNALDIKKGVIIHGCNSHGIMGSGIALEIKKRWPKVFDIYLQKWQEVRSNGQPHLPLGSFTWAQVDENKYIVNAITQKDMGRDPKRLYVNYEALENAFASLLTSELSEQIKLYGVHFPLIGCGLGNGKWSEVEPLIEKALGPDIQKNLYILPK
jgi:O-acetyl-ADP-ribose deacetylase (regulator of RNase III)